MIMRLLSSNRTLRSLCALACIGLWLGCDEDPAAPGTQVDASQSDADVTDEDADVPEGDECDEAEDGVRCGEDRHCIDQRCVFNTCGDGVRAGDEECDDGNEALGDACDPACRVVPIHCGDGIQQEDEECDDGNRFDLDDCSTACTENICGNARLDGLEECDDSNLVDTDECSDLCTENRCRNGRVDPGEECDDGNITHDDGCTNACTIVDCGNGKQELNEECDDGNDGNDDECSNACLANVCGNLRVDPGELCDGDTVDSACSDDCMALESDTCRPCEDQPTTCQNFAGNIGFDLAAGCFDGEPTPSEVPFVDPEFAQDCIDAVLCSRQSDCVLFANGEIDTNSCYCGELTVPEGATMPSIDDCQANGPSLDAQCADEWTRATRGTTNAQILDRLTDVAFPSGWARYLLLCDYTYCQAECGLD